MLLETGVKYRGAIIVDAGGIPVPKSTVGSKFKDIGFSDVEIWSDPEQLPEDWPDEDRQDDAPFLFQQFWAEGTWNLPPAEAVMKGPGWSIAWIRKIGSSEVVPGSKSVTPSGYGWIVPTLMIGMFALVTAIHVKGSK